MGYYERIVVIEVTKVRFGDILAVRTGNDLPSEAIRLGAALSNEPNLDNHIVIVHHMDNAGNIWGIEARPGGVGWTDLKRYYDSPYTVSNFEQSKTNDQREFIIKHSQLMLGTPYDWEAIASDAVMAITQRSPLWFSKDFGDQAPAHVVCSSFAVWLYHHAGLTFPRQHGERWTTPADWTEWILKRGWE